MAVTITGSQAAIQFTVTGNMTIGAVPEPTSAALLLGTIGLLVFRRRPASRD